MQNDNNADPFDEAIEIHLNTDAFCRLATRGNNSDIEMMKNMLLRDPKKFLRDINDEQHMINKPNAYGQNPLYLAAKNGNFEVTKFLLLAKANPHQKSKLGKLNETPLEVASRWNHQRVVEILLNDTQYEKQVLNSAIRLSKNRKIKKNIENSINNIKHSVPL